MVLIKYLILALMLTTGIAIAYPIIDEAKVKEIGLEFKYSIKNKDFSIIEKYMYPGSKVVIDMDPANGRGEKEISYKKYMVLMKMSYQMMGESDIHEEILSISVDKAKNEATVEAKTTAILTMMGMKVEDVSINKTKYGVVNGEIKVLSTEDQLISSGVIE